MAQGAAPLLQIFMIHESQYFVVTIRSSLTPGKLEFDQIRHHSPDQFWAQDYWGRSSYIFGIFFFIVYNVSMSRTVSLLPVIILFWKVLLLHITVQDFNFNHKRNNQTLIFVWFSSRHKTSFHSKYIMWVGSNWPLWPSMDFNSYCLYHIWDIDINILINPTS